MKKLVIVNYLGKETGASEYTIIGKDYGYFLETKKQIKEGDFICIGFCTREGNCNKMNVDGRVISIVKVKKVVDDYDKHVEEGNAIIGGLEIAPIYKEFIGKADLKAYFSEVDKRHKLEEINRKLEARFKEAEKMALYERLAETDPVMKELLAELKELE